MKLLVCLSDDGRQRVRQNQARKIAGYQLQELQVKNRVYYLK